MHGLTNLKITIALSAVTLAGACLCHSCYKCQHISADMALNSKEQMQFLRHLLGTTKLDKEKTKVLGKKLEQRI